MVRECNSSHLQQCTAIAYARNNKPESNSAYCPKSRKSISADFAFIIDNPDSILFGFFESDVVVGVLGCFVNPDNNWVDCSGPFFKNEWNQEDARAMIDYAKSKLSKAVRFNFYFDTRNINLHQLMEALSAERNDNEYILLLKKIDYKPQRVKHNIIPYNSGFENDVIKLKNDTWSDSYITDSDLINSINKDRDIFCALDENSAFVGYGILKRYEDSSRIAAEAFAVAEYERGKGYGWALLNTVVDCALNKYNANIVDLVVDRLNTYARDLYYSCGFKLDVENAAYCITP